MPHAGILLGLSHIFVGAMIILMCRPLLKDKIKMNRWYGVRFKKSFESQENWYKINRYGARRMIYWSVVLIAIGVVTMFLRVGANGIILLASAPAILIIPAIESWLYVRKL